MIQSSLNHWCFAVVSILLLTTRASTDIIQHDHIWLPTTRASCRCCNRRDNLQVGQPEKRQEQNFETEKALYCYAGEMTGASGNTFVPSEAVGQIGYLLKWSLNDWRCRTAYHWWYSGDPPKLGAISGKSLKLSESSLITGYNWVNIITLDRKLHIATSSLCVTQVTTWRRRHNIHRLIVRILIT